MIVILTALHVEQQAVLAHLTDVKEHRHPKGTLFDVGGLAASPRHRVAVGLTGAGPTAAATLTERACTEFSPSAMLFVGIAGGLRDWLAIGDVVVGTKVYSHQGGRSGDDGFAARPSAWEASHALEQRARRLPRGGAWHSFLPEDARPHTASVHFEPIAAGDVLLDSASSALAQTLKWNYNDAVAIEMESSGFARAAHLSGDVPNLTVRGISDHADGTKRDTDREGSQDVAARNAAAFAIAVAASLEEPAEPDQQPVSPAVPHVPHVPNKNIARDNARVGQQIGVLVGDLHFAWKEHR